MLPALMPRAAAAAAAERVVSCDVLATWNLLSQRARTRRLLNFGLAVTRDPRWLGKCAPFRPGRICARI
jgi:hypothetical protein